MLESNYGFLVTKDGSHTLIHPRYLTTFHSHHGSVTESKKVFLEYGFEYIAQDWKEVRILELGFGTGLNAWLTAQESAKCSIQTSYTGIDISFLPKEIFETLNFPYCTDTVEENIDLFTRIHSSELGSFININQNFQLRKIQTDWFEYQGDSRFNLIYFDAFAPDTQPELWSCESLSKCADLLEPGGVLVTYCAKGQVKRNLRAAGFSVTALPGPPGKREVTRAVKT